MSDDVVVGRQLKEFGVIVYADCLLPGLSFDI